MAPSAIEASASCGTPARRPSGSWRRNEVDSHDAAPEVAWYTVDCKDRKRARSGGRGTRVVSAL